VGHFLFRDGRVSAPLHHRHDGMPNEFGETSVSCSAFRLNHGQKGRTDAEALDECVLPFGFVQRGILLCLVAAELIGRTSDVFMSLLDGARARM
jgi:hypothetical protein